MSSIIGIIYIVFGVLVTSSLVTIPEVTNEKLLSTLVIIGGTILVFMKEK
jgi:hypothetical protein